MTTVQAPWVPMPLRLALSELNEALSTGRSNAGSVSSKKLARLVIKHRAALGTVPGGTCSTGRNQLLSDLPDRERAAQDQR